MAPEALASHSDHCVAKYSSQLIVILSSLQHVMQMKPSY